MRYPSRRQFLKMLSLSGTLCVPLRTSAATQPPQGVQFRAEIEPLVRILEETPRERLLEDIGLRVRQGLNYHQLLAALLLAGVRNVQPRPVGFKFHSVLVVHSVHLASQSSPQADRWLPIFWALDTFKRAQARDAQVGDWTMEPVVPSRVPPPHKARQAFTEAMDQWDEAAADAAIVGLSRAVEARQLFDLFAYYGMRDFRDIGHKAIYVANGWRTLQTIGMQHAEPILRSLAYALLAHEGSNPAKRDADADQPFRQNQQRIREIRSDWQTGTLSTSATVDLLDTLRHASTDDACTQVAALLNRGIAPQSIWDALLNAAGELMMRHPGILALHAVTSLNGLYFAYRTTHDDPTRQLLLLQGTAFITLFRGQPESRQSFNINQLQPGRLEQEGPEAIDDVFSALSYEANLVGAGKVLAFLQRKEPPERFIEAARQLLIYKGDNSHDYKYGSAVLEDHRYLSPEWGQRYLAASVPGLHGSASPDHALVARTKAALRG
ncbi:hypothetical protein [Candidatus Entotheonella palauensis]|uniref:Twin-arginine translocation signal domain-containing protein n=1 Tax=Candidatus Entotheonella gemina TaxID=1429439 RepID=W4M7Z7_9BACT|nr:hypothetical protein [Candidatus Entotheonella palauensis]ETX06489.1 MAG: hypothetical protein ETSY2_16800 [Candidatus Entotheonella gemina]